METSKISIEKRKNMFGAELHKSFSQKQYSLWRRFSVRKAWQPFRVAMPSE